jgi:hypothetical protein
MTMTQLDSALREHLVHLLKSPHAHVDLDSAIKGLQPGNRGRKPADLPFSVWRLLEHMRISQWDIVEFSRDAKHVSPKWPDGYWPAEDAPPNDAAWEKSVREFRHELDEMERLVSDPKTDLFARIPHGDGQTILREAMVLADHNSYHIGQIVLVRRLLGDWPSQ